MEAWKLEMADGVFLVATREIDAARSGARISASCCSCEGVKFSCDVISNGGAAHPVILPVVGFIVGAIATGSIAHPAIKVPARTAVIPKWNLLLRSIVTMAISCSLGANTFRE